MKKLACVLMLIQAGFLTAQTKTVATIYGEKIQVNPNSLNTADNGVTATNGNLQLGGDLLKPTTLVTTSSFTLAIKGLENGNAADNVLVADTAGVLKWVARSTFTGDNLGDHTATEDLKMNTKNIIGAKNITASDVITTAIAAVTTKTTTQTAAITAGTDGSLPVAGYVATAADANGNIIWKEASKNNVLEIKNINSNYTVADTDYTIIASGLSGDVTITLPDATSSKGRILVINQNGVSNASGDEVTVKFNVPVKYSDKVSKDELLAPYYSAVTGGTLKINLQSNGSNWYVVSSL